MVDCKRKSGNKIMNANGGGRGCLCACRSIDSSTTIYRRSSRRRPAAWKLFWAGEGQLYVALGFTTRIVGRYHT